MPISVDLNSTDAELEQVAAIFGMRPNDEGFGEVLNALATAALHEYTLALSGTRAPSTLRELRELRLLLLFQHLPGGGPTDTQVAQMLQLTPSAARSLIAGARARYRTPLGDLLRPAAVTALMESTRGDDEDTARVVLSDSLAAYLRDLAAETRTPPLRKSEAISLTWEIKRSTAEELGKRLGFTVEELNGFKKKK